MLQIVNTTLLTEEKKKEIGHILERVIVAGDLSRLEPIERVKYYNLTCESLGLNPFTKPFDYMSLNGKLTLYPKKDATEQLRKINKISITKLEEKLENGIYKVIAYAQDAEGRTDIGTGVVSVSGLKGDALSNAIMKAETKAKRRVTLSIVGLGWVDESEIESIPYVKPLKAEYVHSESYIPPEEEMLNNYLTDIKNASSLDVLTERARSAWREIKNISDEAQRKEYQEKITQQHNLRKKVLEEEAKKISDEFFKEDIQHEPTYQSEV